MHSGTQVMLALKRIKVRLTNDDTRVIEESCVEWSKCVELF